MGVAVGPPVQTVHPLAMVRQLEVVLAWSVAWRA